MALVGKACVDRWEAHLLRIEASGERQVHPATERPSATAKYAAASQPGVRPQGYISRIESEAACTLAGKRLCTLREWHAACRGPSRTTYPYGNSFQKGACNVSRPHLLTRWFGSDPKGWKYEEHFNNPKLNELEGWLAPTGAFDQCQSPQGIYDLVGNLHEWVKDPAGPDVANVVPVKPTTRLRLSRARGRGVFMGGFFSTLREHGDGCNFITLAHEPAYHDYSTGFRCCKDAD